MATRIQFRCASCSYLVKVPLAYAGRKGKCPGCKQVVRIPAEPSPDAPASDAKPAKVEPARSASKAELLAARDRVAKAETVKTKRPDLKPAKVEPAKADLARPPVRVEPVKTEPSKAERKAKPKLAPPVGLPGGDVLPPSMPRSEAPTRRMPRSPDLAAADPEAARRSAPKAGRREPAPAPEPGRSHLFRRVGAEAIRLQVGVPVVIGRSQDCGLTIPSSRVSRRHAELGWRDGRPVLKDLGSQNGTLVNGEAVHEHDLVDGDEIMVGPFLIGYAYAREGEEPEALDFMADSDLKTEFTLIDAMSGRLEEVTLFEVLQTLEFNKKTGTLEVSAKSGTARIGVDQGLVVFARLGQARGQDAVLTALEWDKGRFRLEPSLTQPTDVRLPITGLLLEASRRLDDRG